MSINWALAVLAAAYGIPAFVAHDVARPDNVELVVTDRGFSPSQITAHNEEPVHIHVVNHGHHPHQLSIPDFYIFTRTLEPGAASDVEFTPNRPGRFDMYSDPTGESEPEFSGVFKVVPYSAHDRHPAATARTPAHETNWRSGRTE